VNTVEEMGNPFQEDSDYLFALDTKNVKSEDVVQTVKTVQSMGQQQYKNFIAERFEKRTQPVHAPIHRNKLPLISDHTAGTKLKTKMLLSN
jgi:hypothetical protein